MLMNLIRPILTAALAAAALSSALGQDAPPPLPQGARPFPGIVLGGGLEGPKLRQLVTRPDVQRGIDLNLRQKNEIAELFKDPNAGRISVKFESNGPTDEETRRQSIEDQIRAQQGSLTEKIQKILKPEQYDRLLELDLQWRGPLALSSRDVAERLKIEPVHRQEIEKAAAGYRREKSEVMMKLAERNDDGNGRVMVRLNTKELDNPASPSAKQLTKAKEAAEKAILAALSPEERSRWNKALGEPFLFRVDIPGNRF